jgi:hypothetical protein
VPLLPFCPLLPLLPLVPEEPAGPVAPPKFTSQPSTVAVPLIESTFIVNKFAA